MKPNRIALIAACFLVVGCSKKSPEKLPEATLDELNRAMRTWAMVSAAPPRVITDLTNVPALRGKRLPTPPPGKTLAFDRPRGQVVFVDE